jgi:cytochrome b6-f complex iron-sulfur subunit
VNRRDFCVHACQAVSATTLATLLEGCGGSPMSPSPVTSLPAVNGTLVNGAVIVNIDAASPLSSVGGAALVQASTRSFLVSRTSESAFSALTAICTHEGCVVSGVSSQAFMCPCHGSQFSTAGSVLKGPASRPLQVFATQFTSGVLTITT